MDAGFKTRLSVSRVLGSARYDDYRPVLKGQVFRPDADIADAYSQSQLTLPVFKAPLNAPWPWDANGNVTPEFKKARLDYLKSQSDPIPGPPPIVEDSDQ